MPLLEQALIRAMGARSASSLEYPDSMGADRRYRVLRLEDAPMPGITSYATLGLSERSFLPGFAHRVELVAATTVPDERWQRLLAGVASWCWATGRLPAPGLLLRDGVGQAGLSFADRLPHLWVSIPFVWDGLMGDGLQLDTHRVMPVQLIPLSEAEAALWTPDGEALELALERAGVNLLDPERPSAA